MTDTTYNAIPRDHRRLEPILVEYPAKAIILKKEMQPIPQLKQRRIAEVTDKRIFLNDLPSENMKIGWGIMGLLTVIILVKWDLLVNEKFAIFSVLLVLLPGLWFLLLGYTLPRNKPTIFNRLTGVVQLPGAFWDKPVLTPFDELKTFFGPNGRSGIFWWTLKVERKTQSIKYFFPVCIDLWMEGSWQTWTYWVWYMDRNRPLPPGDALDDYRQMDYERRRAEGFPPPLYKSRFPTPEATPEQQVEREKYWRDEDYMLPDEAPERITTSRIVKSFHYNITTEKRFDSNH